MDLQNFLNPVNKNIGDAEKEENILTIVITYYTDIPTSAEKDEMEKNVEIPILSSPTHDQALQAI
jgi:hypothetical protein